MSITHCRLKKSTQLKLLEYFVLEVTAQSAANLLCIQSNSTILFYRKIRNIITDHLNNEVKEILNGEVELFESYFGGVRKGKRGRGAAGKTTVFGMLKRQGKVYTVIVENTKTDTLMAEIARKIRPDSIVYIDYYRSYNALDISEFHHHRIDHSEEFANEKNHINDIENFWNQAKTSFTKVQRN